MPRSLRIEKENGVYHIINSGNYPPSLRLPPSLSELRRTRRRTCRQDVFINDGAHGLFSSMQPFSTHKNYRTSTIFWPSAKASSICFQRWFNVVNRSVVRQLPIRSQSKRPESLGRIERMKKSSSLLIMIRLSSAAISHKVRSSACPRSRSKTCTASQSRPRNQRANVPGSCTSTRNFMRPRQ